MRNYILYHLYKILYLFSFGKKRKKFYDKFKGVKREYCKEKEWNKNYVKWSKNNNKLIIIDDTGKAQETDYCEGLSINFYGENSTITIYTPYLFKNFNINISSNCTITIHKNFSNTSTITLQAMEPDSNITIGENCMFASGIVIQTTDFHAIINSQNETLNKAQDINIGNHVWLAMNCTILKGSQIPDNSIIAANALYTAKSYIPNDDDERIGLTGRIFMGNPAKCVKYGDFTWISDNCTNFEKKHNKT